MGLMRPFRVMSAQEKEWDQAYKNKDNFVFYPHEEIIRFVSRYIRKRIDFDNFRDAHVNASSAKVLDVGCGVGRHVKFLNDYKLDGYGVDLSPFAIEEAGRLFDLQGLPQLKQKLRVAGVDETNFDDASFDFALSHGVFDSMHFEVAQSGINEMSRILKPGGLMYLDVVSGDETGRSAAFDGEETVSTQHEEGTVQSYFNVNKIERLLGGKFEIVELALIKREDVQLGRHHSRYHVVIKNL